ncbi:hypothetical protein LXL04_036646 [Taraxacum kok-saghyz]
MPVVSNNPLQDAPTPSKADEYSKIQALIDALILDWLWSGVAKKVVESRLRCIVSNQDIWYLDHLDATWQQFYTNEQTIWPHAATVVCCREVVDKCWEACKRSEECGVKVDAF